VALIVMLAAMTPSPGESGGEWWDRTGQGTAYRAAMAELGLSTDAFDEEAVFMHDVPADIAAASSDHLCEQSGTPFEAPWPLDAWPDVPTRFLAGRDDRLFPLAFQRRVVAERLGIPVDEMSGGHLPALAHPEELAAHLLRYAAELPAPAGA
jgi:pimeloyl-ACP methyl ester carboxylesterase